MFIVVENCRYKTRYKDDLIYRAQGIYQEIFKQNM